MVGQGTHRDLLATACQQVIPKRGSCLAYRCRPDVISHIWTGVGDLCMVHNPHTSHEHVSFEAAVKDRFLAGGPRKAYVRSVLLGYCHYPHCMPPQDGEVRIQ